MVVVVVQMVRVWRYGATDWGCYGGGDGSGVRDRVLPALRPGLVLREREALVPDLL